jgi:hypothetical protein
MSVFARAVKRQAKARVALAGPTGSGKTWNGLVWATALGKRIAVVDTERSSASLYAPHFAFDVVDFQPPYDPARLVKLIRIAATEGFDVLMIDSLSHFWEGEGGTLDIVDAAASRSSGNQYAGWKIGTPALRHLVDTMLGCPMHLIVTMRSKMEYVLQTNDRGKQVPQKVGMAPVMRAGVEYEFTLVGDLDLEHRLTISKSRCDLLADWVAPKDRIQEAAERFAAWLDEGAPEEPAPATPPTTPVEQPAAATATPPANGSATPAAASTPEPVLSPDSPDYVPTGDDLAELYGLAGALPRSPKEAAWVDEQLGQYSYRAVRAAIRRKHASECGENCDHVTGQAALPVGGAA